MLTAGWMNSVRERFAICVSTFDDRSRWNTGFVTGGGDTVEAMLERDSPFKAIEEDEPTRTTYPKPATPCMKPRKDG